MTEPDLTVEMNEYFSDELISYTKDKLVEAFNEKKNLTDFAGYVRQMLMDKEKGSWMCLFLPDDIKYSYSLSKFRYLRVSLMRKDQKYWVILA